MSYSSWDWADSFRLIEAACLIAGVPVESKWGQTLDEVPINALPVFRRLAKACALGALPPEAPEDPRYPKAKMLKTLWPEPTKPMAQTDFIAEPAEQFEPTITRDDLHEMTGWKVTRDELHRWVGAMGIHSAYDFGARATEGAGQNLALDPNVLDGMPEAAQPPPLPVRAETALGNAEPVKAERVDAGWVMKRSALIKKHICRWPTIERDLRDASENGLSNAAKAPVHGEWFETLALNWAKQRTKYTEEVPERPAALETVWSTTQHKLEG